MNEKVLRVTGLFAPLWREAQEETPSPDKLPLLAHYCSIPVLESISKNNEIWFSNPLFMNDLDELRFGIRQSRERFRQNEAIANTFSKAERYETFTKLVENAYDGFEQGGAFDIYVLCFCAHERGNSDGLLSMWRGYGANGGGAAIVFDPSKLKFIQESPIQLGRVRYGSSDERILWIDKLLSRVADALREKELDDEELGLAAYFFVERMLTFALFTKHNGFDEEREWRAVYLRHHDYQNKLVDRLSYFVTPNGVHPKLKLKFQPLPGAVDANVSLENLVESIILGPSLANALSEMAIGRMLEQLGRPYLATRVRSSSTPFRS
jgi:SAM-dependent methyltransferase